MDQGKQNKSSGYIDWKSTTWKEWFPDKQHTIQIPRMCKNTRETQYIQVSSDFLCLTGEVLHVDCGLIC